MISLMSKKEPDSDYSDEEAERRARDALRRSLRHCQLNSVESTFLAPLS
jgi:hypothetical protein